MKKRTENEEYLQKSRSHRSALREKLKNSKNRKKKFKKRFHSSSKLDFLSSIKPITPNLTANQETVLRVELPKTFSIIKNPKESLNAIALTASGAKNNKLKFIHFDHSKVTKHDLGAEMLLGEVAAEVKNKAKYRNRKVEVLGKLPHSERQKRLICSMGVVKKLNIRDQMITETEDKIELFDFVGAKSKSVNVGSEDRKNRCGRTFVDHLNKCLKYNNRQLTDTSIQRLLDFLGEIIGNAEDHSGQKKWFVSGYLDESEVLNTENTAELHFCEIIIFNFGKSIAETFQDLKEDSYAYSLIEPYLLTHKKKGFFLKTGTKRI